MDFEVKSIFACTDEVDIINDFEGKVFNRDFKFPIYITVFPLGEITKVLISYFKVHATYLERIIKKIEKASSSEQEIMISNILVKKANNIIYNPKEFKKFSQEKIDIIGSYNERITLYPGEKLVTLDINLFRP